MTKKEFENLYGEKLNLKSKNWFLMPERSVLSNNKVIISGHKEIDFDYLYFIVKDEVWEMYLQSNVRFVEQDFLLPQGLFKRCIAFAKDFSYGVDKVQFKNSGIKGQVIVILDHFAKKVVSVLEEKPVKSDATKWGENMISEKEIAEFDSFKTPSSDWVVPNGNATTIVPEEMFEKFKENYKLEEVEEGPVLAGKSEKPSILSSANFDFETETYLEPGELNSKKKIREPEVEADETFKIITDNICELLEYKNNKYGNSALQPLDIFTGKSRVGNRLDDKLARVKTSEVLQKNDVADIIGYLILVCKENNWTTFDEFKD